MLKHFDIGQIREDADDKKGTRLVQEFHREKAIHITCTKVVIKSYSFSSTWGIKHDARMSRPHIQNNEGEELNLKTNGIMIAHPYNHPPKTVISRAS